MGGMGKTELALQYAMEQFKQGTYPGGICWLRARDQEIATQIITFFQVHLGLTPPDQLEIEAQVHFCWQQWPKGNALVILDDVTDSQAIKSYLPSNPRFKLLITTRLKLGSSVEDFPVEELDEDGAIALLESLVKDGRIQAQLEDTKSLCRWVGHLPLALELLGSFLARKPDWTINQLLKALNDKQLNTKALIDPGRGMKRQLGVAAALELSWKELSEAEQELACVLGMFAIAPIPWSLVEQCTTLQSVDLLSKLISFLPRRKSRQRLSFYNLNIDEIRDDGLVSRSLLKRVSPNSYQLHQIVQKYFRHKLHQQPNQGKAIKRAFLLLMVKISKDIDNTPTITQISQIKDLIIHLSEVSSQWISCIKNKDLIWVFLGIGKFFKGQGYYALAETWYRDCLEVTQNKLGNKHPDTLLSLNNLALLYSAQGRYEEAEVIFEKSLDMAQKMWMRKAQYSQMILTNLAQLYVDRGRYEEAEEFYKKSMRINQSFWLERIYLYYLMYIIPILNNWVLVHLNKAEYEEAENIREKIKLLQNNLLQKNFPSVAFILNNWALLHEKQGRYKDAELFHKQSLAIRQKLFGLEHIYVVTSYHNLAGLYATQGRYLEAEVLYNQSQEILQKIVADDHPYVGKSFNELAELYINQGFYEKAEPLYLKVLQINKKLGKEHPDIALIFNNLARLYNLQGRYDEAEPLHQQALQMQRKLLGKNHPDVAKSFSNLATLFENRGQYKKAELLYKKALWINRKVFGLEHPDIARSLNNLAGIYSKQCRYKEAHLLLQKALQIRLIFLSEEHPQVLTNLNNLAVNCYELGKYEEAELIYKKVLKSTKKSLGLEHLNSANTLNNLASLYNNQGRYEEAEPLYCTAVMILLSRLGDNHPDTQMFINNFTQCLSQALQSGQADRLSDHPLTCHFLAKLRQLS